MLLDAGCRLQPSGPAEARLFLNVVRRAAENGEASPGGGHAACVRLVQAAKLAHATSLLQRRVSIVHGSPLLQKQLSFLAGQAGKAVRFEEESDECVLELEATRCLLPGSRLYLADISPISRLYLAYISPGSRLPLLPPRPPPIFLSGTPPAHHHLPNMAGTPPAR